MSQMSKPEYYRQALTNEEFFHQIAEGSIPGHQLISKFGKNANITTNYTPLCAGGLFPTPQPDNAVTLRIKAGGDIEDNQAGSGARAVVVEGITTDGSAITETLLPHATNGTLVGEAGSLNFIRVVRAYVVTSGTYATATAGSHVAAITIENTSGTEDWCIIGGSNGVTEFPRGQSHIGVYTVPLGHTAYLYNFLLTTDGNKPIDLILFQRSNILETVSPYTGIMRTVAEKVGITEVLSSNFDGPHVFPELTDVGWMVKGGTTPIATVDFEILLVDNTVYD